MAQKPLATVQCLLSLKCFLSQAGVIVTLLYAEGLLLSCGLNTGCLNFFLF